MTEYPASLRPEYLMECMQAICKEIGPRPATSNQERLAADYVEKTLRQSAVTNIQRQLFKSSNSFGRVTIPCFVAGILTTAIVGVAGQWGKLISSALLMGSGLGYSAPLFEMIRKHTPIDNCILGSIDIY